MLTEISTFGWYNDTSNLSDLSSIATFGWFGIALIGGDGRVGIYQELGDMFDEGMWG